MLGNMGATIPNYGRVDNSDSVYLVGAVHTVTNEVRLSEFLESNSSEVEQNKWWVFGCISADINT